MNTNSTELSNIPFKHCRYCNHPITAQDNICKHCFEEQDESDIETVSLKDSSLAYYDWLTLVFSTLIGIILGNIYLVVFGEDLRGKRLIKYSLILMFSKLAVSYPIYYIFKTFHNLIKMN